MWNSSLLHARGAIIAVLLLFAATAVLSSCGKTATSGGETGRNTSAGAAGAPLAEIALQVPTISCTGCWPRIEASAKSVPGVKEVKFDEKKIQRVVVIYDPSQTTVEAIVQAIETRGDKVTEVIRGSQQ